MQWWEGDDVTWAGVVHDHSPERKPDGVEHWIASLDDRPIGWISCGDVARWAEESATWGALARAGFRRAGTYGVGAEECTLMLLDRVELEVR